MRLSSLSEQQIVNRLNTPPVAPPGDPLSFFFANPQPAAVLVPLLIMPDEDGQPAWNLLFTRRTDLVGNHKGQVAFPGGRCDPGDQDRPSTARREAFEEIGLLPHHVKVIGQLEQLHTISNYLITPIVATIPWPYTFTPQPAEVSRIFTIPMGWLADPGHYEIRHREVPANFINVSPPFLTHVTIFQPYDGETLWGVSAEIVLRLLRRLKLLDSP